MGHQFKKSSNNQKVCVFLSMQIKMCFNNWLHLQFNYDFYRLHSATRMKSPVYF